MWVEVSAFFLFFFKCLCLCFVFLFGPAGFMWFEVSKAFGFLLDFRFFFNLVPRLVGMWACGVYVV